MNKHNSQSEKAFTRQYEASKIHEKAALDTVDMLHAGEITDQDMDTFSEMIQESLQGLEEAQKQMNVLRETIDQEQGQNLESDYYLALALEDAKALSELRDRLVEKISMAMEVRDEEVAPPQQKHIDIVEDIVRRLPHGTKLKRRDVEAAAARFARILEDEGGDADVATTRLESELSYRPHRRLSADEPGSDWV